MAATTLTSGPGFDWLIGGLGADTYSLAGSFGTDIIDVGAGIAETGLDVVEISGHFWEDTIVYRSGDHYAAVDITTGDLAAVLDFYAGTADSIDRLEMPSSAGGTVTSRPDDDLDSDGVLDIHQVFLPSYGTDGNDTLTATTGTYQEVVYGGLGNDTLTGSSEFSVLFGGGGNDTFNSAGGAEDTNMVGGSGGDTYRVFSSHAAVVSDQSTSSGDRLEATPISLLSPNIQAFTIDSRHLFLGDTGNGTGVIVMDWQASQGKIETYALGDGTHSHATLTAILTGAGIPNFSWEEIGLSTAAVNRDLEVLAFMDGDDAGPDFDAFGGGTSASDTITGFSGDNIAYGGTGDDTLVGGLGDDRYPFRAGDGDDTVDNVTGAVRGETNTLEFGPGIAPADLSISTSGIDLIIGYTATDSVRLSDYYGGGFNLGKQVAVAFVDDGSHPLLLLHGTAGDDLIFGLETDNWLFPGPGNDTVYAGAGDDTVEGDTGDDTLDGGPGADTAGYAPTSQGVAVNLGAGTATGSEIGTDTLVNIENATGGSGGDALTGSASDNRLRGLSGNDTLHGGRGDDTLEGGAGQDVLHGEGGAAPPPQAFVDSGLFPDVTELVDIGAIPGGDAALGIIGDDTTPGDTAIATLTFAGEVAGYANSVGAYMVAADGTIGDVDLAFEDVKALDVGDTATVALPGDAGTGTGFGLFLIVHGARLNDGYQGLDLDGGTLSFVYDFGGAGERAARITDAGTDVTLVHDDGPTRMVLEGPVVHSTERGGAALLNPDNTVHVAAGRPTAEDDTTLRIGFEDMPGGGDTDFNDVILDLEVHPGTTNAADTLAGGADNDTLVGGIGEDLFQFGHGGGTDRIEDFQVGSDLFDLVGGISIASITDVDADGDTYIDDTLVTLTDGAVELIGVTDITETDLLGS